MRAGEIAMTEDGIRLRAAGDADAAAIEALLGGLSLPLDGVREWIRHFWVGESGGRLVGVAGIEVYHDGALLRSVAVDPGWRSSGLGRALVDQAMASARAAGATEIFLLTTTAEGYFPRLGFETTSRDRVPAGVQASVEFQDACPASAVVMRRAL
jgi:amino-acid N-acetyltransferase